MTFRGQNASGRLDNGVRVRADGKGDVWADSHRNGLGKWYYMTDIDALFGTLVFGQNTAERLFMEYVPDSYSNRDAQTRDFAVVAMFDRKRTEHAAFNGSLAKLSKDFYLWLCRRVSEKQPTAVKFFYVIGGDSAPWTMIEMDLHTGQQKPIRATIDGTKEGWITAWQKLGLLDARSQLRRWVESR